MKVHLVLVDGMRPDALSCCTNPYIQQLLDNSLHTLNARCVFPSVTLPCHMSLFHSVDPDRHGITTNFYMPQVRPVNGICEQLKGKRTSALVYNWEELRDLTRPGSLTHAYFFSGHTPGGYELANQKVTAATLDLIADQNPDFIFTYLGWTDEAGHAHGWMTDEYFRSIDESFGCIQRIIEASSEDTVTIVVADHGGHGRGHGTTEETDMLIPVILHGKDITPGILTGDVSIKDISPTVVKLLDCAPAAEWEGTSLL